MTGFFGGASSYQNEDGIKVNQAAINLKKYFMQLIGERRKNPQEDYVSLLVSMQRRMNIFDDELISQLIMMLVAGMATTTDQMNNNMFLLASSPEIYEELKNGTHQINRALEEFNRFDPAVTFIFRVVKNDMLLDGHLLKAGEVIFISTHAVNRDLPPTENPFELDISKTRQHLAYGHGPHFCIGAKLARMEMQCLFEKIIKSFDQVILDTTKESCRDHYSLSFSGFKELHLKIKPAKIKG